MDFILLAPTTVVLGRLDADVDGAMVVEVSSIEDDRDAEERRVAGILPLVLAVVVVVAVGWEGSIFPLYFREIAGEISVAGGVEVLLLSSFLSMGPSPPVRPLNVVARTALG